MQHPFPFIPKKIKGKSAPPVKSKVDAKVEPNAWLTDGPVRPIERGLPISPTPPPALDPNMPTPMENFVNVLVERPYMKSFRKMYGNLAAKYPEFNFDDPDNLSLYEKEFIYQNSHDIGETLLKQTQLKLTVPDAHGNLQTTVGEIPLNAHLYTFGGAIPYFESQIFEEEKVKINPEDLKPKKIQTGIHGPAVENPDDALATTFREIHFDCLSPEEIEACKTKEDSAIHPLNLIPPSLGRSLANSQIDKRITDNTVTDCISEYFTATGKPFVPRNVEKYFPLSVLTPKRKTFTNTELERSTTQSVLSSVEGPDDPYAGIDPKSTLLDTSDQDVLFTTEKAPFKRSEIAELRAFNQHWDRLQKKQNEKFKQELRKRSHHVQRAFQSREVMKEYLNLLDEDYRRINAGIIGKCPFKNKSMWQVACERAPKDMSSLGERMKFWWRFGTFVSEIGGIRDDFDHEVMDTLRHKLMDNHPINNSLFFEVVNYVSDDALQSVSSLKLIEFMRITLDINQKEFMKVFTTRHVSQFVYTQAILTNISSEHLESMNRVSKMHITVPEVSDLK